MPRLQIACDYPVYKAALLAIKQTKDTNIISYLEEYAKEILEGVQTSIDEGEFSITIINIHSISFDYKTGQILSDEFSSKSIDDVGTDQVEIINGKTLRIEPDLTQMPDFQIFDKSVEQLSSELLNSILISNNQQQSEATIQSDTSLLAGYSGSSAASYIRTWVAVTTLNCNTPSSPVYQDKSKYNPAYTKYTCADCANYVSQALRYGGMVTNSTWQPYTNAWIDVLSLKNYIISHDLGYFTSCSLLGLGDLGIVPNTHVVMVSALNPLRYSAHTNDRKNYAWQSSLTTCINVY